MTPITDREDKVIRHYCDISWQERYDLMREHAQSLERKLTRKNQRTDAQAIAVKQISEMRRQRP